MGPFSLLISLLLNIGVTSCISTIVLIATTPLPSASGPDLTMRPDHPSFALDTFWLSELSAGPSDVRALMLEIFSYILNVVCVTLFALTIKHMISNACPNHEGYEYHQMLRHARKCSFQWHAEQIEIEHLEYGSEDEKLN